MAELLFAPLEALPFAVDAVVHARWVPNRDALAQIRRRISDVENIHREQSEGDHRGPGLLAEEDRYLAREFEATLRSSGAPADALRPRSATRSARRTRRSWSRASTALRTSSATCTSTGPAACSRGCSPTTCCASAGRSTTTSRS